MAKPIVKYDSQSESGNIYSILGYCARAMKKVQKINDFNLMRDRVFASKSYAEALAEIWKDIDLIDTSEVVDGDS